MSKMYFRGFILKDYLLSLMIVLIFLPILIENLKIVAEFEYYDEDIMDTVAIMQLRRKVILYDNLNINDNSISYDSNNEHWELKYDGNRLYLTPGYQLFIDNVENLNFEIKNNILYICYEKKDHYFEKYLLLM